jgi:hypothetical protein
MSLEHKCQNTAHITQKINWQTVKQNKTSIAGKYSEEDKENL